MRLAAYLAVFGMCCGAFGDAAGAGTLLEWAELPELPPPPGADRQLGLAGPFVGVDGDALIVAGGANFPEPVWETAKAWHDDVYVLLKNTKTDPPSYRWVPGAKLDRPVAYGASVSTRRGVLCIGGNDADRAFADVFLLRWNAETETVDRHPMPSLPAPCTYAGAAAVGDKVYVAGGATGLDLETAGPHFWTIDLADVGAEGFGWRRLPPWPGPPRAFAVVVAQHNGSDDCVYVISGRRVGETGETEFLTDVYEFTPAKCAPDRFDRETGGEDGPWRRRADAPRCVMAGAAIAVGRSHVLVLGGDDGSMFHQADILKNAHPGFPKEALAYHTVTNTWTSGGPMPANHVTTTAVRWGIDSVNDPVIIASGEIRPRVRSPKVWRVRPLQACLF